jgi:phage terminase large subunit
VDWRDNPWFPETLRAERDHLYATDPDKAEHVWGGEYVRAVEGAYFAQQLREARLDGRITWLRADPLIQRRAFWDIGIRDATAIWVAQFVGGEIRVIDYIEGVGQPLAYYVEELRARGHRSALCVLPHDGVAENSITALRYEDHVRAAGFETTVVKNQGKGAAMMRVEAARRLFPRIWIDEDKCAAGLKALAAYHERWDDKRNAGMGPEHDWASHGADAFGLMCVAYEEPRKHIEKLAMPSYGVV